MANNERGRGQNICRARLSLDELTRHRKKTGKQKLRGYRSFYVVDGRGVEPLTFTMSM